MPLKLMTEFDLRGKRVLIREDLNVPLKDGRVSSDARLLADDASAHALPVHCADESLPDDVLILYDHDSKHRIPPSPTAVSGRRACRPLPDTLLSVRSHRRT